MLIGNEAYRSIAKRFEASESAVYRHQQEHLPKALVKAKEAAEMVKADALLDHVRTAEGRAERLYAAAEQILTRALADDAPRTALQAIKAAIDVMGEARQYLELRGEITGELKGGPGGAMDGDRPNVTIVFPVMTEEDKKAVENAVVIDMPNVGRRLLTRPSDGSPR